MISYAQNFEDVILARVFQNRTDGFYVDVGAMDPELHSVTKHFYDSGWCGINIEPNPEFYAKLVEARPRDRTLPYCISDKLGITTFHIFDHQGISTLDEDIALRFEKLNYVRRPVQAHTITLSVVLADAPDVIDFLKVDVEGWELQVLRSNDWSKFRPLVVVVEALEPGDLTPTWQSWETVLTTNGYKFVYFDALNRFYLRDDRLDLETFFSTPPNLFDSFQVEALVSSQKQQAELSAEVARLHGVIGTIQQELSTQAALSETDAKYAASVATQNADLSSRHENWLQEREGLRSQFDDLSALRVHDQQSIGSRDLTLLQERANRLQEMENSTVEFGRILTQIAELTKQFAELSHVAEARVRHVQEFEVDLEMQRTTLATEQKLSEAERTKSKHLTDLLETERTKSAELALALEVEQAEKHQLTALLIAEQAQAAQNVMLLEAQQKLACELTREIATNRELAEQLAQELTLERNSLESRQAIIEQLQKDLQEHKDNFVQGVNRSEQLNRDYLKQRLWAGQLAQEKADLIGRLRILEREGRNNSH